MGRRAKARTAAVWKSTGSGDHPHVFVVSELGGPIALRVGAGRIFVVRQANTRATRTTIRMALTALGFASSGST